MKEPNEILVALASKLKGLPVGFGIRTLSFLADVVFWFLLLIGFSFFLNKISIRVNLIWIGFLSWAMYEIFFLCSPLMATPGKLLFNLKVVDEAGDGITFGNASVRNISKFFSIAVTGLGIFAMFFNLGKQTWHDKLCQTYVIIPFTSAEDENLLDESISRN